MGIEVHFFLYGKKLMKHATYPKDSLKRSVGEATAIEKVAFDFGVETGIQIVRTAWDKALLDYIGQVGEEDF